MPTRFSIDGKPLKGCNLNKDFCYVKFAVLDDYGLISNYWCCERKDYENDSYLRKLRKYAEKHGIKIYQGNPARFKTNNDEEKE